jgi:DNA-binding protein H-NS
MAKTTANLRSMSVDALLKLRDDIGATLSQKGRELQSQLQRLGVWGPTTRTGRSHPRKGTKVAPKYRGPNGETWAGRGATPKWLSALIKQGHKRDEFLIAEPAAAAPHKRTRVKRSSKRSRAKRSTAKRK